MNFSEFIKTQLDEGKTIEIKKIKIPNPWKKYY